jgi:hypothetical protein
MTTANYIIGSLEGFPAILYAVGTNNQIVRVWIGYGGDINAVHCSTGHPLLAFAIINADNLQSETTLTVATLLSHGAQATVIPKALHTLFCEDLPDD